MNAPRATQPTEQRLALTEHVCRHRGGRADMRAWVDSLDPARSWAPSAVSLSPRRPLKQNAVVWRVYVHLICWWFGCVPDYAHPGQVTPYYIVPCKRCGAMDTTCGDRVGDTRHARAMAWLRYWGLRRWWPTRDADCGQPGKHDSCVPF